MKITKDTTWLITQDSIMVAPQEVNDDANWTLVESKKTQKERKKAKQENFAAFPPLPSIKKHEESVNKLSKKPGFSSKWSVKLKLNKIFKNIKSDNYAPKEVVIDTNTDIKQKYNKRENNDEVSVFHPLILTFFMIYQLFQFIGFSFRWHESAIIIFTFLSTFLSDSTRHFCKNCICIDWSTFF